MRCPSFLEIPLLTLFDLIGRGMCARAKKILIDDFADVRTLRKSAPPEATILLGAGVVSGVVARRAAELKAKGFLGDTFYFAGGLRARSCEFAKWLLPSIVKSGISAPKSQEAEGPYALRVFVQELDRLGVDRSKLKLRVEDKGLHFQAHLQNLKKLGADQHRTTAILALPYGRLRAVGTFYHEYGRTKRVTPVAAWLPEIGIREEEADTRLFGGPRFWKNMRLSSILARAMTVMEAKKFGLPTQQKSPYGRGNRFCTCFDVACLKAPRRPAAIRHEKASEAPRQS